MELFIVFPFVLFLGAILMSRSFGRFFKSSKTYRKTTLPLGSFLVPRLEFLEGRINPSFANIDIIAQSLRLAEDALPQVPGLDASVGQMLPDRLSDLIGLNAYGNGANSWSQFDTLYPNPTVANLNTIANTIVSGSPYSSTITPTSGTTPSAGNALLSSLNYIQAGLLPDLMLGQYAGFTVQAWFNSTNIGTDWQRIIDLGNGASSNNIIVGVVGSQLFINSVGSGPNYIAGPTLASNTWYHVSAVFSGTTASVYLNGVLQLTLIGMPQTQNVARSGNYWGKSNWPGDAVWQGQQDELRFWNRALTASEIAANYNITYVIPQSGLLAYYKADESSGSIMNDSSGNGNTANYLNITGSNASSAPVYPQNGVQIQWSETGTYNSVFSTGGLDAGLHLSKSGNATLPITVSGQLGLTLSLEGAMLQTGISTSWTANAALTNLTLGVGLGYLDSSIEGGVYNLNTTISAALFDTVYKLSVPGPNITENNNGVPISPITNQV
ncbi:MAG: LamG domain-containing protein, partial [Planctomycetota bacterium]